MQRCRIRCNFRRILVKQTHEPIHDTSNSPGPNEKSRDHDTKWNGWRGKKKSDPEITQTHTQQQQQKNRTPVREKTETRSKMAAPTRAGESGTLFVKIREFPHFHIARGGVAKFQIKTLDQ